MKRLVLGLVMVVVSFVSFASVLSAQGALVMQANKSNKASQTGGPIESMRVGTTGKLVSIATTRLDKVAGIAACGDYLGFTGVPDQTDKVGGVLFASDGAMKRDGEMANFIFMLGTDKIQTRIVEGLKVPTMTVLRAGGPVYPWIEIRISSQDYERASCLKHTLSVV